MKKRLLLLCLPLLLAACGAFSSALGDADVARYIKACDNFAAAAPEDYCKLKGNIARSKDAREMRLQCVRLRSYTSYLDRAGAFAVKLAEKLLKDGDIEVVAKHIDAISAALSNDKLPSEFRHSSGGGFDD